MKIHLRLEFLEVQAEMFFDECVFEGMFSRKAHEEVRETGRLGQRATEDR